MRTIELSIPEALIREALPRATDEEVAALVGRFAGRSFPRDNEDLLQPFTDRDTPRDRVGRIRLLLGCMLTGRRNGWALGMVSPSWPSRGPRLPHPSRLAPTVGRREDAGMPDPDDDYPPEAIRVLQGMTPPRRRPAGHVEDRPDPEWLALPPEERAAALERAVSRDGDKKS